MPSVLSAVGRRLPPPLADTLQRWRGRLAHAIAGAELHQLRVDAARQVDEACVGVRSELRVAVDDLLERQDLVLASYDRRVAALVNRVLELEDALAARGTSSRIVDANEIIADHGARQAHGTDGVNVNR